MKPRIKIRLFPGSLPMGFIIDWMEKPRTPSQKKFKKYVVKEANRRFRHDKNFDDDK